MIPVFAQGFVVSTDNGIQMKPTIANYLIHNCGAKNLNFEMDGARPLIDSRGVYVGLSFYHGCYSRTNCDYSVMLGILGDLRTIRLEVTSSDKSTIDRVILDIQRVPLNGKPITRVFDCSAR